MKPASLCSCCTGTRHGMPQQQIYPGLITLAVSLEPIENILVKAHGYGFLRRAIKLAHLRATPIHDLRHIREINIFISLCGDRGDVAFLLGSTTAGLVRRRTSVARPRSAAVSARSGNRYPPFSSHSQFGKLSAFCAPNTYLPFSSRV